MSTHAQEEDPSSGSSNRTEGDNTQGLLVLLPDRIDIEEEARFYEDILDVRA